MNQEQWNGVDRYIEGVLMGHDAVLEAAIKASEAAGLPKIQVAPNQGKFLHLLARLVGVAQGGDGAGRILEIGTLGGYSTIWLARGLKPGGKLISLEVEPTFAEVARRNIARASLTDRVEVRVGRAVDSLVVLAEERSRGAAPFDLVFIDADKANTPEYFGRAMKLTRAGSIIVVDNVVRDGEIVDESSDDPGVQGMRRFFAMLKAEEAAGRVSGTAMQMVGVKGWDGMALAMVL